MLTQHCLVQLDKHCPAHMSLADTPNAETGWSPSRAKAFGASHVTAFVNTVPTLLKERKTKEQQQQ